MCGSACESRLVPETLSLSASSGGGGGVPAVDGRVGTESTGSSSQSRTFSQFQDGMMLGSIAIYIASGTEGAVLTELSVPGDQPVGMSADASRANAGGVLMLISPLQLGVDDRPRANVSG